MTMCICHAVQEASRKHDNAAWRLKQQLQQSQAEAQEAKQQLQQLNDQLKVRPSLQQRNRALTG